MDTLQYLSQDSEARRLYEFFEKVKNLGASYGRVPQNKELSQAAIAWPLGQPLLCRGSTLIIQNFNHLPCLRQLLHS